MLYQVALDFSSRPLRASRIRSKECSFGLAYRSDIRAVVVPGRRECRAARGPMRRGYWATQPAPTVDSSETLRQGASLPCRAASPRSRIRTPRLPRTRSSLLRSQPGNDRKEPRQRSCPSSWCDGDGGLTGVCRVCARRTRNRRIPASGPVELELDSTCSSAGRAPRQTRGSVALRRPRAQPRQKSCATASVSIGTFPSSNYSSGRHAAEE